MMRQLINHTQDPVLKFQDLLHVYSTFISISFNNENGKVRNWGRVCLLSHKVLYEVDRHGKDYRGVVLSRDGRQGLEVPAKIL